MMSPGLPANWRAYVIVAAVAFLCYANSLSHQFVFDDKPLLLGDPASYDLDRLPGHFTGEEGYFKTMGRYYRPLVALTYAFDRMTGRLLFGGMDPKSYHLTNVLIHVAVCLVLLALLTPLLESTRAALLAALVFAAHPIHTESVAWISGRTDSLAGLFYFMALLAYLRHTRTPSFGWLWLLFGSYGLALLSKEMAVTLPAALILLDLLRPGRRLAPGTRYRIYAGLIGLTLLFLLARQGALSGITVPEAGQYFFGQPPLTVLATMLQTIPVYARLLIVPTGLLYHYNGVLPYQDSPLSPAVLPALVFVLVTFALALWWWRRQPLATFAILFFYLALLPVMNIVPTFSLMAERFLFIPSLSIALLIGWLIAKARRPAAQAIATIAGLLLIGGYAFLTIERNRDWSTDDRLFRAAEGTPGSLLNVNLGNVYSRAGDILKAEQLYLEALAIREENSRAHLNLGVIEMSRGARHRAAAAQAEANSEVDRAELHRARALTAFDQSRRHLERARELEPAAPEILFELAHLALAEGRPADARRHLHQLSRQSPNFPGLKELRHQLGP